MLTLSELLYILCEKNSIHICIHDISGILQKDNMKIDSYFKRHSKPFCDMAKSSEKGYRTCIECKDASNRKAASGENFERECPYGIYEIVRPVIIDEKVRCIIYLGNLTKDTELLRKTAAKRCEKNGISDKDIEKYLDTIEKTDDEQYFVRLSEFLRDFIINIYSEDSGEKSEKPEYHWCVSQVCEYASRNYRQNMTLARLSDLYFINEKYLGRIFKRQVGKTFHEYLTDIRLEKAVALLLEGKPVNFVANECGFQNVTYFNRSFRKKFLISPTEYKKLKK